MELKAGYKQTEVGPIPQEWDVKPILDAVRIASGQVNPTLEAYRSMILVAPDHIESGTGRLLAQVTASDQRAISGKYLFDPGDIVYSKIRPYLRKAILADFRGLCSADMYPLKPAQGISSGFVLAVLLGERFSRYVEAVSVRSGIPKVNREDLAGYVIGLPPIREQRAIAAVLADVDALLATLDQLITKKRDIKLATTQQLLTGQRRLPGFQANWESVRLSEILSQPATYGIVTAGGFKGTGVPMVRGGDIKRGNIDPTDLPLVSTEKNLEYSRTILKRDDVVIALVGYPGEAARVRETLEGANISRAVGLLRLSDRIVPDYLVSYFNSPIGRAMVLAPSAGSAQLVINLAALNRLRFHLPAPDEQRAIAAVLSDMDAELAALEARRTKTLALKQGMMQELLTGRTRLV